MTPWRELLKRFSRIVSAIVRYQVLERPVPVEPEEPEHSVTLLLLELSRLYAEAHGRLPTAVNLTNLTWAELTTHRCERLPDDCRELRLFGMHIHHGEAGRAPFEMWEEERC